MATYPVNQVEDRVTGVLLGLAAGDRNGGPVRMALAVAESLRDRGTFDADDIGERYLQWWREGAFDTGATAARVLALSVCGVSLKQALVRADQEARGMTAGCNPAHRAAPIAMSGAIEDSQLAWAARKEAALTHRHPLAGDVAAAVVVLCRALIRGTKWATALALASAERISETRSAIETRSVNGLSQSGFAPDALRAAVYFVDTSESFALALNRSIRFAEAPNYCPVLVGSIAGARWGASHIGMDMLAHHETLVPRLRSVADDLVKGWADADSSLHDA
jgi:ADP-ribosylglycohydrolase